MILQIICALITIALISVVTFTHIWFQYNMWLYGLFMFLAYLLPETFRKMCNRANATEDTLLNFTISSITIVAYATTTFFFPSIGERLMIFFIGIWLSFVYELKQNKSNHAPSTESQIAWLSIVFGFSSIYWAINSDTVFWNIIAAIVAYIIWGVLYLRIQGINEYDHQERQYNNSDFGKNTEISFSEVINNAGAEAEYITSNYLNGIHGYHRNLYNVTIPDPTSTKVGSQEIDGIVIMQGGIVVYEVKNWRGSWLIDGNETQARYEDRHKNLRVVKSPVTQNKAHIHALIMLFRKMQVHDVQFQKQRRTIDSVIKGLIVFGPSTIDVHAINMEAAGHYFCSYRHLDEELNSINTKAVMSKEDVDRIYRVLLPYQNNTKLKDEHLFKIKALEFDKKLNKL